MGNIELSDIRMTLEGTNSILIDIEKSLKQKLTEEPETTPLGDELLAELSKHNESLERIADSLEKIVAILKNCLNL